MITPDYCEKLAATLKWAAEDSRSGRPSYTLARRDDVRSAAYLIDDLVAELRTLADGLGNHGDGLDITLEGLEIVERWRTP